MPTEISGSTGVNKITDGTVVTADIAADAVDGTKIADNAINSEHITAGGVDDAHLATGITASKLTGALPAISAASLTNVPKDTTVGGRKNLFINGGFDLWQRGTSLAGANNYLADRWYNTTSGTQSRQTFTVGQTDVPHNPTYYYRQVTGSTEWFETRQKIENVALTAGREVTLSYWMKSSSAFTNAPFRVQNFGSGGSSEVSAALTTASVTTSWAKYTQTFTLPSVSGKTIGAGSYLQIHILRANLNSVTVDIANVQLEYGDTATDFEQRSYGEELALCQRYCTVMNLKYLSFWYSSYGTHWFSETIKFPTTMRGNPSVSLVSGSFRFSHFNHSWKSDTLTSINNVQVARPDHCLLRLTATGSHSPTGHGIYSGEGVTAFIKADAEL